MGAIPCAAPSSPPVVSNARPTFPASSAGVARAETPTGARSLPGAVGCGMVLAVSSSPLPAARWRALFSLSVAELLALSLWFSASAILPALAREWHLGDAGAAALTIAVHRGFNANLAASGQWRREQAGAGSSKWEGGVSDSSHSRERDRGA